MSDREEMSEQEMQQYDSKENTSSMQDNPLLKQQQEKAEKTEKAEKKKKETIRKSSMIVVGKGERLSTLEDIGLDKDKINVKDFEIFSRRHDTRLIVDETTNKANEYAAVESYEKIGLYSETNSAVILKNGKLKDIDVKPGFELVPFLDDKISRNSRLEDFMKRTESYIPSAEKSL